MGVDGKVKRLPVSIFFAMSMTNAVAKTLITSSGKINAVRDAVAHQSLFGDT